MEMYRIHSGILTRCPVKDLIPDFPCPGHYKHSASSLNVKRTEPCGRAQTLCSLGVFSDMLCHKHNDSCQCGRTTDDAALLSSLLRIISTKGSNCILQLGAILDMRKMLNSNELDKFLKTMEEVFKGTSRKVFHVLGDQETAMRAKYMESFLAENLKTYKLIKQPSRCCGSAYYSERIGPEYVLLVLDGYELLTVDTSSNGTKKGFKIELPEKTDSTLKCPMCESKTKRDTQVGWAAELPKEYGSLDQGDIQSLPPIYCALSEHQLEWLNLQLQEATRKTDNIVVACHLPLHPLLVKDRSALPINWKEVLCLLMKFNCVRLVLSGRPSGLDSEPPDPEKPYQYDHEILYYSVPGACQPIGEGKVAWTHLLVEMGYDFIRIKGEGMPTPPNPACKETCDGWEWTIPFEPRRKLRMNHYDYTFNGGYDF